MWDPLHPFETGYEKMADVWFTGIFAITHPVADAGPDQSVEKGDTVTLDASNSVDPDGMIDSYFWEQMPGGGQVVLSDPEVVNPTFTAPDVGLGIETLTFQVTVTDDDGLESTDTTYVYVSLSDELAIDMGSTGLWHYDGSWESITAWNVEGIEQWNDTLAIDMGSIGLWEYDGTNWTGITGVNVDGCVAWSQGLAIDMGSIGLWNYDGTNWTSITGVNVDECEAVDLY